jgi:hypothetical protein
LLKYNRKETAIEQKMSEEFYGLIGGELLSEVFPKNCIEPC